MDKNAHTSAQRESILTRRTCLHTNNNAHY